MSFSRGVKRELAHIRLRSEAQKRAQLYGLTHAAGMLKLGRTPGIEYVTETHEVGRHIAALATSLYDLDATLSLRDTERRLTLTVVTLNGEGCEALLTDAGLFQRTEAGVELTQGIPREKLKTEDLQKAFLRGAFMGAGSCSDPKRAYHLEIVCRSEELAQALCGLMGGLALEAKTVRRKERTVVYLKEGDRIASFLALLGASTATLSFEDTRAEKELRNYINRTSNCETANIGKTVNAAGEQLEAIERILRHKNHKRLTPALRETAELRLHHPDASLQELADLAGIGKSGMNHRLQRLLQIAERLS
ncbi:MAG TPA: DNA-binding protein WhiA [Feifaniaceae bacterium]|nr:DNA-binding protein WhiA [Feifaniaceae bacterium]